LVRVAFRGVRGAAARSAIAGVAIQ
jgi:hypothetical protein